MSHPSPVLAEMRALLQSGALDALLPSAAVQAHQASVLPPAGTLVNIPQATTALAPPYVEGAVYYDLTLHKLRVGGAADWETITSV